MQFNRIILLTGMGGDSRLTRPVRIPGIRIVAPDHIEPEDGEDLARYAARIAAINAVGPRDVVGGVSFGGMLAAEISRQRPTAGLILLGSCLHPERMPWSYRAMLALDPVIPDAALRLRTWGPFMRWRFAPITPEGEACLSAMADICPSSRIRAFARMIFGWSGVERPAGPFLSIHGDRDRIIPLGCAEPGLVLKDAGHSFTLTHAEQTSAAVASFLKG